MPARRIIIVEGDSAGAVALDALLTRSGYQVTPIAASGQETISVLKQVSPHLHPDTDSATDHELEERFFAVSIDMLCCLDFSGHFRRLNPAWERTLGFTPEELMSRPFIEFVHPEDRERTLAQNREVRSGAQALGFENRYLCKDGSYKWFLWNAAADAAGRVIFSVARDITARKQSEEEREALVRELQLALTEVRTLQGILPICSYCKKIRDDDNYWQTVESYISRKTNTQFSHSICPACYVKEMEPQLEQFERDHPG